MENFAEYILNEEDLMQKMEITYIYQERREFYLINQLYLKQK